MKRIREILTPDHVNMIIYHGNCHDGFAAAWVARSYLTQLDCFHPAVYGDQELPDVANKNVLMVDFSYSREICQKLADQANKFVILDHHVSAEKELAGLDFAFVDKSRSGATLAWDYFFPGTSYPKFLRCIETRDIWKFAERQDTLPEAKPFTYYWYNNVKFSDDDFAKYDEIYHNPKLFDNYTMMGQQIMNYIDNEVQYNSKWAADATWNDARVKILNCTWAISDTGNYLSNLPDVDFVVLWNYNHATQRYHYSLRSNGQYAVNNVAEKYQGGGHKAASGFVSEQHPHQLFQFEK